jgi:hypothetical protein
MFANTWVPYWGWHLGCSTLVTHFRWWDTEKLDRYFLKETLSIAYRLRWWQAYCKLWSIAVLASSLPPAQTMEWISRRISEWHLSIHVCWCVVRNKDSNKKLNSVLPVSCLTSNCPSAPPPCFSQSRSFWSILHADFISWITRLDELLRENDGRGGRLSRNAPSW